MPLPKFSLQVAFSWSVYFSNRTELCSSQIEFAGPHGIICNFTFSYLILSKTIGRKRLRTQSLVEADLGQLVYTYKRVVCVCLLVCLSVFFLSATRHLSTLRRCLRVAERAGAVAIAGGPARRAGKHAHAHSESTRAHAVQLLNEKIAALMPFKNKTVRAPARPLPEMLAFFFAFLKDLALEFAFSHFSGICTKNRIFRQLSQLPILFLCESTCFGWHSYL